MTSLSKCVSAPFGVNHFLNDVSFVVEMTATRPYEVTVSDDKSQADMLFPHFSYYAYSGAGLPNPWYIARCFESGRALSAYYGFIHGKELIKEAMFVIMKADYTFNWELLSAARRRSYFPYRIVVSLKRVGKSSIVWHHDMVNVLDDKILASLDAQMIYVSRKTRLSTPFPPWFLDKYERFTKTQVEKPRFHIPEVPPSPISFSLPVTVMPSSIDQNAHLNNSEIVRFSLDCVAVASRKNHFKNIKGDVRAMWLSDLSVYYRKEGLMGDVLTVTTWEGNTPGEVMCMLKRDNEVLSFQSMRFKLNRSSL